jgi:hypothetical protein
MTEKQVIVIHGIFHSGTNILKSLIGDHSDVHNVIGETNKLPKINWQRQTSSNYIIFKTPYVQNENKYPKNYKLISIVRNPFFVYSSLLKRFNKNIPKDVNLFNEYKKLKTLTRTQIIKYEDLFEENFLSNLFSSIGLKWDNSILSKKHKIFDNVRKKEYGKHREHNIFRENQINEKFENKNDITKIELTSKDIEYINLHRNFWEKYYPDTAGLEKILSDRT